VLRRKGLILTKRTLQSFVTVLLDLLAMAANLNLRIDQMDAVTAFLQGELKHEIYMLQPEGFQQDQRVCRLRKSLYGLKQASRIWNEKLD